MKPLLASHVRWSWNGGTPVYYLDQPTSGEVVVTGCAPISHRTLSRVALQNGRQKPIVQGWASGALYAVTEELANRFTYSRQVCWSDPPRAVEPAPETRSDNGNSVVATTRPGAGLTKGWSLTKPDLMPSLTHARRREQAGVARGEVR